MYIIVGLGNPTDKYAHTRHNVGFDTIDYIADKYCIAMDFMKHKAICGKGIIGDYNHTLEEYAYESSILEQAAKIALTIINLPDDF